MSVRTILIGVLAVIFGLASAVGIWRVATLPSPSQEGVDVVMAVKDIPRFAPVTVDDLKVQKVPPNLVPPEAIFRLEDALDRSSTTFIGRGEFVLNRDLSSKGVRGMAANIPTGMRAVTIRTPDVSVGVAGFVLPGSKVDVLLTERVWNTGDSSGGGSTVMLLENVEVLAVDQRVETPAEHKVDVERQRSVTVLVTPDQSAKLELGQTLGTLHLSLRNPRDDSVAVNRGVSMLEVRHMGRKPADVPPIRPTAAEVDKPPKPAPKLPPEPPPIRVLRGTQMSHDVIKR